LSAASGSLFAVTNVKSEPIEAVLFDWAGTLATWHEIDLHTVWRSVAALIDEERAEELAKRLVAAEGSVWRRSRDEHLSSTLEEVCLLAEVAMTPAALAEYERQWQPHTVLEPDALETLGELRDRGLKNRRAVEHDLVPAAARRDLRARRRTGADRRRRLHERGAVDEAASGGVPGGDEGGRDD
jgi:FMN phosphatase YigB (HAD superfamily)